MCSSADGHLTKKSSAFATVSAKYGTQSLIHDHMMSHYRRINNAKSTIDNKAPKSVSKSIKVRDRQRQNNKDAFLEDNIYRPNTARSIPNMARSRPNTARARPNTARIERQHSHNRAHSERPMSAYERLEDGQLENAMYEEMDRLVLDYPQDIVENNHGTMDENEYRSRLQLRDNVKNKMNLSYRENKSPVKKLSSTPRYKIEMYGTESESNPVRLKGSIFNTARTVSHWKSKLGNDSTLEKDKYSISNNSNMGRSSARVPTLDLSSVAPDDVNTRLTLSSRMSPGRFVNSSRMSPSRKLRPGSSLDFDDPVAMKLQEQEYMIEEEQKYLRFIEDVTSDVLTRRIFSDRVLNQVFETHVERKKHELDETRMWSLIKELREDLNMKEDSDDEAR